MTQLKSISAWSEQQRLVFVERLLFWRGTINRKDLCEHFGISLPQATKDLVTYTTMNPSACTYDVRKKCYVASESMKALLQAPDFGEAMSDMAVSMMKECGIEFVLGLTRPERTVNRMIFRKLSLAAYREQCVEVSYWSVTSGMSKNRWISPRAFGDDGLRWHVRAFDHSSKQFRDFVVGRFESVGKGKSCPYRDRIDADWIENVNLHICANPELDSGKRQALEMDYQMESGRCVLTVRKAMQVYALRRLGFVEHSQVPPMLNELKELLWEE